MFTGISIAQLIFSLLSAAPTVVKEIEDAINQHWGKDHIVQAQKGLEALTQVVGTVGAAIEAGTSSSVPSAQMGSPPHA